MLAFSFYRCYTNHINRKYVRFICAITLHYKAFAQVYSTTEQYFFGGELFNIRNIITTEKEWKQWNRRQHQFRKRKANRKDCF